MSVPTGREILGSCRVSSSADGPILVMLDGDGHAFWCRLAPADALKLGRKLVNLALDLGPLPELAPLEPRDG